MKIRKNDIIDLLILLYTFSVTTFTFTDNLYQLSNMAALMLISVLLIRYLNGQNKIVGKGLTKSLILFWLVCIASLIWSHNFSATFVKCKTLTIIILLTILLYSYSIQEEKFDLLLLYINISGTALALYIMFKDGLGSYISNVFSGMRMGENVLQNVNTVGLILGVTALINFWLFLCEKNKKLIVLVLVLTFSVVVSGCRTATIAMLLAMVIMFVINENTKKRLFGVIKVVLVVVAMILVLQLPIFGNAIDRMMVLVDALNGTANTTGGTALRLNMMIAGWNSFLDKPFTGVGIGATGTINLEVLGVELYMHNNYIELLSAVGIFGTVAYYSIFYHLTKKSICLVKEKNKYGVLVISLVGYLLISHIGAVEYSVKYDYVLLVMMYSAIAKSKHFCIKDVE